MGDAVERAAAAVPREFYTDHPTWGAVPQATAQWAIERDLRRAAVAEGMSVLEIGTGTGLTGALLAELVGPEGKVTSVDIDSALTERAAKLHAERDVEITLVTGDGHAGHPAGGPYDRIIGWATPTRIPAAWAEQTRPGGVISTPVYLAPVARTVGHIRVTVDDGGDLIDPRLGGASYVDMGAEINTTLGVPMFYLDAREQDGEDLAWVSVAWRGRYAGHDPSAALAMLRRPAYTDCLDLGDDEEARALAWRDFRAYCAGRDQEHSPSSLTAYGTAGWEWTSGIGFSSGNNAAMLTADGRIHANREDSPALAKLRDYVRDWREADRPGLEALHPTLHRDDRGWLIRTTYLWER